MAGSLWLMMCVMPASGMLQLASAPMVPTVFAHASLLKKLCLPAPPPPPLLPPPVLLAASARLAAVAEAGVGMEKGGGGGEEGLGTVEVVLVAKRREEERAWAESEEQSVEDERGSDERQKEAAPDGCTYKTREAARDSMLAADGWYGGGKGEDVGSSKYDAEGRQQRE